MAAGPRAGAFVPVGAGLIAVEEELPGLEEASELAPQPEIPAARPRLASRKSAPGNTSRTNVFWLSLPSLGESWHHNHHAFPRSAVHGLKRWELDPSALVISTMEKLGFAWNVVRISPERQAQKII